MLRSNLKTGILCGIFYGLAVLFLEDLVALFVNQMEFSFKQIFVSLMLYAFTFALLGLFFAAFFSVIGSRSNRSNVISSGTIVMWLSAFLTFYIGHDEIDNFLVSTDLHIKIIIALGWGLVVLIGFFFIVMLLKKGKGINPDVKDVRSIAFSAMLATFVIITVKIRYDPITAERVSTLVPYWRILVLLFSLGIFFLAKGAVEKARGISGFSVRSVVAGFLLVIGSTILAQFASSRTATVPILFANAINEDAPHNILFIIIDALRADHMSLYGYDRETTHWISEYSRNGVVFENALAVSSWTKPSMASIFTGRYPGTNGMDESFDSLPLEVSTIPEILHDAGYVTKGISSNRFATTDYNFDQGFDDFLYLPMHNLKQLLRPKVILNYIFSGPREFYYRLGLLDGNVAYGEARTINKFIFPWLHQNKAAQFFLYLHYMEPHFPYYPFERRYSRGNYFTGSDLRLFEKLFYYEDIPEDFGSFRQTLTNRYDDEIGQIDLNLKGLFQVLDETDLWKNTLVIITSDHGEELIDHGYVDHGHSMYHELLHVPLIMMFPDGRGAGQTIKQRVDLLDLAPTLYDYLGIDPPEALEGVSLLPLIEGNPEDYLQLKRDYFGQVQPLRPECFADKVSAIMEGDYKLIRYAFKDSSRTDTLAFYDLSSDPDERTNLLNHFPDLTSRILTNLESYQRYCDSLQALLPAGDEVNLDDAQIEQLRALGYVE